MAQALTQAPLFFYAQSAKPAALYGGLPRSVDTARKFAQGTGTALLALAGANNVAGATTAGVPLMTDFTSVDGFTQAILEGRLTGPAQLIAGALLFLAAGKCTARLAGLLAGLALVYLYTQGHTVADGFDFAKDFTTRLSVAIDAFRHAGADPAA